LVYFYVPQRRKESNTKKRRNYNNIIIGAVDTVDNFHFVSVNGTGLVVDNYVYNYVNSYLLNLLKLFLII